METVDGVKKAINALEAAKAMEDNHVAVKQLLSDAKHWIEKMEKNLKEMMEKSNDKIPSSESLIEDRLERESLSGRQ